METMANGFNLVKSFFASTNLAVKLISMQNQLTIQSKSRIESLPSWQLNSVAFFANLFSFVFCADAKQKPFSTVRTKMKSSKLNAIVQDPSCSLRKSARQNYSSHLFQKPNSAFEQLLLYMLNPLAERINVI